MSNHVTVVTDATFDAEVIHSAGPVLVDFWAPWCGPCRALAPIVEQLAEQYEGRIKVVKVDTDQNVHSASRLGVQSIPTLVVFRNGEVQDVLVGARPRSQLAAALDQILGFAPAA